jgi:pyruvate dehydrogenase (quinone)
LAFDGPALLDVHVNPDQPPMPAKVNHEQAINFAQAFLRGQPRRVSIASTIARDKIEQLKP